MLPVSICYTVFVQAALKQQIANINKDPNLDAAEKEKRKYNLLVMHVHLANSGRQGNNFPAFPMFGERCSNCSKFWNFSCFSICFHR